MMRKKFRRKKTNLKLIFFLIVFLCTSLGYAIYSQELVINGNISGSADFRVYFAEAWIKHSVLDEDHTDTPNGKNEAEIANGTVNINTSEGADRVRFNVTLNCPGDKVLIGTRIKNESSMRVKLNDFLVTKSIDIPDIVMNYMPISTTTEKLEPDGECIYEFVVEWIAGSSDTNPGTVTFSIELDYEQDPEPGVPDVKPSHDHGEGSIYKAYFDANGGIVTQALKNITYGKKYGTLPMPTRGDHEFLGWYTAVEVGTKIKEEDTVIVQNDITLYAKWNYVGHSYSEYQITIQPACTEVGEEQATCSSCGDVITRSITALGHDYTSTDSTEYKATDATCTESATYYKTCTRCGEVGDTTFSSGNALGHSLTKTARVEATCTGTGNIEHYTCSRCSKKFSDSAGNTEVANITIAAKGHSYANTKSATICQTCSVCGNTTGHTSWTKTKTSSVCRTCNTCGYQDTSHSMANTGSASVCQTCSDCGLTTSHSSWTANKTSSLCRTCNTCGYKDTSHSYGSVITDTAAQCNKTGTGHKVCSDCKYSTRVTLSKVAHSYTAGRCVSCSKSTGICKWCKRCYECGKTSGNYTY